MDIGTKKVDIGTQKVDIGTKKWTLGLKKWTLKPFIMNLGTIKCFEECIRLNEFRFKLSWDY